MINQSPPTSANILNQSPPFEAGMKNVVPNSEGKQNSDQVFAEVKQGGSGTSGSSTSWSSKQNPGTPGKCQDVEFR